MFDLGAALQNRFYHHLDRGEFANLAALLTEDGIWLRQGRELQGPAAIIAALHARPAGYVTRHLVSNVVVDPVDERTARVQYELTVYAKEGAAEPRLIAILSGGDEMKRTGKEWRIAHKTAKPTFGFP